MTWVGRTVDTLVVTQILGTFDDVLWLQAQDSTTGQTFWLLTFQNEEQDAEATAFWQNAIRALQGLSHSAILAPLRVVQESASSRLFAVYHAFPDAISLSSLPGSLTDEQIVSVFTALSDAIESAHAYYRDHGISRAYPHLNPQRVFVNLHQDPPDVRWFLIPAWETHSVAQTRAGAVKGNIAYISPELVKGQPRSQASDFFVMGAMLAESMTGHRAFQASSDMQTLVNILQGQTTVEFGSNASQSQFALVQELTQPNEPSRLSQAKSFQEKLRHAFLSSDGFGSVASPDAVVESRRSGVAKLAEKTASPQKSRQIVDKLDMELDLVDDESPVAAAPPPPPAPPAEAVATEAVAVSSRFDLMESEKIYPQPASAKKSGGLGSIIGGLASLIGGGGGAKAADKSTADDARSIVQEEKPVVLKPTGEAPKMADVPDVFKKKDKSMPATGGEQGESKKEAKREESRTKRARHAAPAEKERGAAHLDAEELDMDMERERAVTEGGVAPGAAPQPPPSPADRVSQPVTSTAPAPAPAPQGASAPASAPPVRRAPAPQASVVPVSTPLPEQSAPPPKPASPPMFAPVSGKPSALPRSEPASAPGLGGLDRPGGPMLKPSAPAAPLKPKPDAKLDELLADDVALDAKDAEPVDERMARILRRKGVVRSYTQMNPGKIFPLLVSIVEAEMYIKMPDLPQVQQIESEKVLEIKETSPYVRIVPVLPGCLISPPEAVVDVREKKVDVEFWIAPQSEGDLTRSARIQIWHENTLKDEIPVPCTVVTQTLTKIASYFSVFSSLIGAVFETYGKKFIPDPKVLSTETSSMSSYLLQKTVALLSSSGIWLGLFFLLTAVLCYLWLRPKEGDVIERFLTTDIH